MGQRWMSMPVQRIMICSKFSATHLSSHHGLGAQEFLDQGDVGVVVTVKEETEITYFDKSRWQPAAESTG
jgi:hypothetical protein